MVIYVNEVIEVLFIWWVDGCTWLSRKWFVSHIFASTTEKYYPQPNYTHIYCLVTVNVQQMSINTTFFLHGEIQWHISASSELSYLMLFTNLLISHYLCNKEKKIIVYKQKNSTSSVIPPASISEIMDNVMKTGRMFGMIFVCFMAFSAPLIYIYIYRCMYKLRNWDMVYQAHRIYTRYLKKCNFF